MEGIFWAQKSRTIADFCILCINIEKISMYERTPELFRDLPNLEYSS